MRGVHFGAATSDTGSSLIRLMVDDADFVGIGPATARRLWSSFGEELPGLLERRDMEALQTVLTRHQAEQACRAWQSHRAAYSALAWLERLGIDQKLARKAIELWGDEAATKLKENPYRLLCICNWEQVDAAARSLGFDGNSDERFVAAVEAALYERLDLKHTVTAKDMLLQRVASLLSTTLEGAEDALSKAVFEGAVLPRGGGYQPSGAAYAERFIENEIRRRITQPATQQDLLGRQITVASLEAFLNEHRQRTRPQPTDEQEAAVRMALSNRVSILVGGAGVGKTTTLKAISTAASTFGLAVHQLALAGRAAQRMAEATERPAQTIASWLAAATGKQIETHDGTLVIVDEASMLDLPTLYRLLFHLHPDARLLLVGDEAQLPPIGYGLTFHRFVDSAIIPMTKLTRVLRAGESTGIPEVSHDIRRGRLPPLQPKIPAEQGCALVQCDDDRIIPTLAHVLHELRSADVQIIGPTYSGPAGIDAINTHFHRFNAHGRSRLGRFAAGDPVIWLNNDYDRGLWNGSMGRVEEVRERWLSVNIDERLHDLSAEDAAINLDLAYAISVHKAQGSQWKDVVVALSPSRLLDRSLLYTAITRAARRLIIVGRSDVLARAVKDAPRSLQRAVGLSI